MQHWLCSYPTAAVAAAAICCCCCCCCCLQETPLQASGACAAAPRIQFALFQMCCCSQGKTLQAHELQPHICSCTPSLRCAAAACWGRRCFWCRSIAPIATVSRLSVAVAISTIGHGSCSPLTLMCCCCFQGKASQAQLLLQPHISSSLSL